MREIPDRESLSFTACAAPSSANPDFGVMSVNYDLTEILRRARRAS